MVYGKLNRCAHWLVGFGWSIPKGRLLSFPEGLNNIGLAVLVHVAFFFQLR